MDGFNSDNLRFVENRLTELSNPQGDIDDDNSFRMSNVVIAEDGKAFWIDTNLLPDESKFYGAGYTRQIETMIFPCDPDGRNIDSREVYRERYDSVEDAITGHKKAIKELSEYFKKPPLSISTEDLSFNVKPDKDYLLIEEYANTYGNTPDGFIRYLSDEIRSFNNDNTELTLDKKMSKESDTLTFKLDSMHSWAKDFNLFSSDNFVINKPIYVQLHRGMNELSIINPNIGLVLPAETVIPIPERARNEIIQEIQNFANKGRSNFTMDSRMHSNADLALVGNVHAMIEDIERSHSRYDALKRHAGLPSNDLDVDIRKNSNLLQSYFMTDEQGNEIGYAYSTNIKNAQQDINIEIKPFISHKDNEMHYDIGKITDNRSGFTYIPQNNISYTCILPNGQKLENPVTMEDILYQLKTDIHEWDLTKMEAPKDLRDYLENNLDKGGKIMDVTRFNDKLSDNSIMNLIDIDNSGWKDPEATYSQLNDIFSHLETDAEHKIELINMGSRSEPDLFICATLPEMKDEFIVKISQEGRLEFDPQILTRSKDVVKEAAEAEFSEIAEELPDINEEDIQVATDMLKESMEKVSEKEFIGDKSVDEFLKDTVSDLENRGLSPDIAKSLTKELIPEKGNKEMRNQLKSDIKELKESIDKLTKEVRQELGVAKINGLNKDTAENINNKVTAIAALTEKHAILKEKLEQNTPTLAESIKEFGAKAGRAITKTIDNIDKTLDAKIQNGKTALERIGSSIRDCNNKAFAGLETAYTGLEERVAQIHRGFLVNDYIHSKNELEHLNKLHDTLEHRFDRFNEIKRAFTNLGHAISGKEQNYDVIQYSEKQQAALSSVEAQIADVKEEITSISQEYNISKSISEYNLESTKDLRRGYGLKECKTLDEMIGKIKSLDKAADDKMNKHAPEKSGKEAKSRNDDDGARTR